MDNFLATREKALIIVEQLQGIGGSRAVGFGQEKIASLPDAIAKAIALDMGLLNRNSNKVLTLEKDQVDTQAQQLNLDEDEAADDIREQKQLPLLSRPADICPACGNATLVHEMGCKTCHGCGFSEC